MRITLVIMLFVMLIAGCGVNNPSPLVINGISPPDNVVRGDRLWMTIKGVEDPSELTLWVNGTVVAPEVVYFNNTYWVVVFTPKVELKVGSNTVTAMEGDRQDSADLEVFGSRLPIETSPFWVSISPEDHKVVPNELVTIRMGEAQLAGEQVNVEMISPLDGKYTDLTSVSIIEGDVIKFNIPAFVGKVLLMVRVGEEEIFDYIEFFRE